METKISIILPFYNAGRYISQTVKSIIDQTFDSYELILIDDGSTDDSTEIIKLILINRGGKNPCSI